MFIVSFYSYKGGVGRTATLLNTAWFMALRGRRIALLDLDLEAPGLSFANLRDPASPPSTESHQRRMGFCELATYYQEHKDVPPNWNQQYLREGLGPGGRIALLAAGNHTDESYESQLHTFSWYDFYIRHEGDRFMVNLAADLAYLGYEYLFIDARTGLTDVAFISTVHMPDLVVLLTNLAQQSIDGIAGRIRSIEKCNRDCARDGSTKRKPGYEKTPIEIVVAASPMPRGEWSLRNERVAAVRAKLGRPVDVEIDYLDLLAVGEADQILLRRMNSDDPTGDAFLASVTRPYQQLAGEIARRNPESPENLIESGRRLWEMGLWRVSKAHYDEACERIEQLANRIPQADGPAVRNPMRKDLTWQEARLGWMLADLDALDPDATAQALEGILKTSTTSKPIRVEQARLCLALAFRYILLNRFPDSAKAAKEARHGLEALSSEYGNDARIRDLLALANLREGYAWMLSNRWEDAARRTAEACNIYRRLAARPLLLSLAQCQMARIDLARGTELDGIEATLADAERCIQGSSDEPSPSAPFARILSQHVAADFHHAMGLLRYEQGQGVPAGECIKIALELFREDKDRVGESDLDVLQSSLFVVDDREPDDWRKRIGHAIELRIPATAFRLALARWSGFLATHAWTKGDVDRIAGELSKALSPLSDYWDGSLERSQELLKRGFQDMNAFAETWRFDPALPALIALEHVRLLLSCSDDPDGLDKAQDIWQQVCTYRDRAACVESPSPPDIDPELRHSLLLLEAILALARGSGDDAEPERLSQRLSDEADSRQQVGYSLRAAQLRLVLALLDPTTHASALQSSLSKLPGGSVSEPDQPLDGAVPTNSGLASWPWTLPVAFVPHSRNSRLKRAWQALGELNVPLWSPLRQGTNAS